MSAKAPIFEETVRNYLAQVAQIHLAGIAETLAVTVEQGEALIPFFGKTYRVSGSGVFDDSGLEPIHAIRIVLCRYLLLAPPALPREGEDWVSYKDFRDAAPFVSGFVNNSERSIARNFSGRLGTAPGRRPAVWEPYPRRWNYPTSSPAGFRPCPKSPCSCCLMMRMKISGPMHSVVSTPRGKISGHGMPGYHRLAAGRFPGTSGGPGYTVRHVTGFRRS